MLFNGIWTGFVAAPYLALAPVHFPRIASYFVMPLVEISTFVLWLVGVILLGIQLPSSKDCNSSGCEATLATVVLSAIEWSAPPTLFHPVKKSRGSTNLSPQKPVPCSLRPRLIPL